jgi:hypothetical protein
MIDDQPAAGPGRADDWIEAMLRRDAAERQVAADDAFTRALMQALPPPRPRSRHRWIVAAMAIAGFVVGFGLLSGGEELSFLLTGLASRAFSIENLLLAAIPLGVLYWMALSTAAQET